MLGKGEVLALMECYDEDTGFGGLDDRLLGHGFRGGWEEQKAGLAQDLCRVYAAEREIAVMTTYR